VGWSFSTIETHRALERALTPIGIPTHGHKRRRLVADLSRRVPDVNPHLSKTD
jgi:hypothetical protein